MQDEYKKILELNQNLIENIQSATKYKVAGRTDMARMYLAKVRYESAQLTYQTDLVARDVAIWYQDYFILKKEDDSVAKSNTAIEDLVKKYKESYKLIAPEYKFYDSTRNQIVGPAMLIFGILFGICGLVGVVYYIRRMQKKQNSEMFGMHSSRSEKNDMMIKYYTQNPSGEAPTKFLQRISESSMVEKNNSKSDEKKPLIDAEDPTQIKS